LNLLCALGRVYLLLLLARIILSWFPISPDGAWAGIASFLYSITEPVLGPLRRALPPVGIGGMGLDLSPLIVIIGLQILLGVIGCGGGLV
jgi:YggT family protein